MNMNRCAWLLVLALAVVLSWDPVMMDCHGQPEFGQVSYVVLTGWRADQLYDFGVTAELSMFIPAEPLPGECLYLAVESVDEAGNRSGLACPGETA